MSAAGQDTVDVRSIPVLTTGRAATLHWGMWGLIIVESMVFASLFSTYFYLRIVAHDWPPAGTKEPELLLPTINTGILLVSAWFVYRADKASRYGDQRWLKLGLSVGLVLALTFLVIKVVEYSGVKYQWDTHAYASIVWTITGFHTLHVIALVLKTIVVLLLAFRGRFTADHNLGVQVNGLYWMFVVVIWIPVYLVLYYGPRVLG